MLLPSLYEPEHRHSYTQLSHADKNSNLGDGRATGYKKSKFLNDHVQPAHPTNLECSPQKFHMKEKGLVFFKPFYFGNFLLFYLNCTIPNCPEEILLKTNKKMISQTENGQKSWIGNLWRKKYRWPINIWKQTFKLTTNQKMIDKNKMSSCLSTDFVIYNIYDYIYLMIVIYIS